MILSVWQWAEGLKMLNLYRHVHNGVDYYVEQDVNIKLFDENAVIIKEFPNKLAMLMWFELKG